MAELRVVVVGGGGVGKSALTVRFIQGNFVEKYDPTIEDSYRKQVDVDGTPYMLDVMDTAGQEEYSALRDSYMKTGQGFILAYDVTSLISFDHAMKLRTQIVRIKDNERIPIVLVGNKADLLEDRVVKTADAEAFAKKHNLGFLEVSAKANMNVNEMFLELVHRMVTFKINEKSASSTPGTANGSAVPRGTTPPVARKKKSTCLLI